MKRLVKKSEATLTSQEYMSYVEDIAIIAFLQQVENMLVPNTITKMAKFLFGKKQEDSMIKKLWDMFFEFLTVPGEVAKQYENIAEEQTDVEKKIYRGEIVKLPSQSDEESDLDEASDSNEESGMYYFREALKKALLSSEEDFLNEWKKAIQDESLKESFLERQIESVEKEDLKEKMFEIISERKILSEEFISDHKKDGLDPVQIVLHNEKIDKKFVEDNMEEFFDSVPVKSFIESKNLMPEGVILNEVVNEQSAEGNVYNTQETWQKILKNQKLSKDFIEEIYSELIIVFEDESSVYSIISETQSIPDSVLKKILVNNTGSSEETEETPIKDDKIYEKVCKNDNYDANLLFKYMSEIKKQNSYMWTEAFKVRNISEDVLTSNMESLLSEGTAVWKNISEYQNISSDFILGEALPHIDITALRNNKKVNQDELEEENVYYILSSR
jgi:hypothetical protein